MHYLILAVLLLMLVYAGLRAFLNASPKTLARTMKNIGGVGLLLLALFFAATGRFAAAAPLGFFALTLLFRNLAPGFGFNPFPGNANKSTGQNSRVRTDTVEMELDHDTGDMDGHVLTGEFAGRRLSSLGEDELRRLLSECAASDAQAAHLVEAYLDRHHPEWRGEGHEETRRKAGGKGSGGGPMSVDEALEILGLGSGASSADIRRAHRELMKKLHPDHGGSTYLAAKINQAKDLLLGRERTAS